MSAPGPGGRPSADGGASSDWGRADRELLGDHACAAADRLAAEAPPLSPAVRDQLAILLRPGFSLPSPRTAPGRGEHR